MWEQIERNRRNSVFVVAALGVLLVVIGMAVGMFFSGREEGALVGGVVALGLWGILWLTMRSRGDDIMLGMAGARQIEKKDHPQLFNVVEEMTIASSLPKMPRVFVVDDPSPNAFAVGRDPEKASVAVTIGLLRILDRDELQGVVAHELGHIKNRDVALMTTAGIMLGAIVLLAEVGRRALWWGGGRRVSRNDSGGGAQAVMMVVAILLMLLAPIFAQLIYFALSRKREYLADASGAMFTRYPEGLASALEKLGGKAVPQADQSRVTAPMYIVRPLQAGEARSLSSAFSTHPPLEKRIRILRTMGTSADFAAYDRAFAGTTGKHVIGKRSLAGVGPVPVREPAGGPVEAPRQRVRQASNAFLAGAGYQAHECVGCGAILKIPPEMQGRLTVCPRCATPL
jgi:heat shock protein HtpX